jgi:hypothetical protein
VQSHLPPYGLAVRRAAAGDPIGDGPGGSEHRGALGAAGEQVADDGADLGARRLALQNTVEEGGAGVLLVSHGGGG